jgi:very-short-patch-repair endonuclease
MRNHDFDRVISRLAGVQHGAFNLTQIKKYGGSKTMVKDRVDARAWLKLAPCMWAVAGFPPTWQRQFKAAELSIRDAVVADRAAALVHGFEGFKVVHPALVIPYTANPRSDLAHLRRSNPVPSAIVDRITVTTVAQTLFDLLPMCELSMVERAMDGAILNKQVTVADLVERRDAFARSRRPQLAAFQALVDERRADGWCPPESTLEANLTAVLARLPPGIVVVRQGVPPWWSPGEGRVDALIPAWRLIAEVDGRRWHARVADFDRDRWRDNVALANGYRVMRFTHTHISQRPDEVFDLLLAAGKFQVVQAS